MTAYDNVIQALEANGKVRHRGDGQASAQCPAHEDREPSLSVTAIEGSVLVYCHAGCDTAAVLDALNMTARDLYDDKAGARYDYTDRIGTVVRSVIRTPEKRFRQTGDTKARPVLFRLPQILEAVEAGTAVYLVEGEKDVLAIEAVGGVATTAPQGARNVAKADLSPLDSAHVVAVVDADDAGTQWAQQVAHALGDRCASLQFVTAAVGKDAADHIAAGRSLDELEPVEVQHDDAPAEGEVQPGSTWAAVDLAGIITGLSDGTLSRPSPDLGQIEGAGCLLYAGKVNGIAGASGAGKSWTALVCTVQCLQVGHVVYVDLEDDPAGVVGRLLDLGASPADVLARFHYVRPDEAFGVASAETLAVVLACSPVLVVIDSTGEALALDGARPNDDDDVARWFRKVPARIARQGPAVLVLDHMTKAEDGGLWPIGSQRKRAAISGAQYVQTVVQPFSRDRAGLAKLVCAKDRHGPYAAGDRVADLVIGGGAAIVLRAPAEAAAVRGGDWRPTALMERVSRAIEDATEPLSFRSIDEDVRGKADHKRAALRELIAVGHVVVQDGPRNAKLHSSVRPYRQHDDPRCDLYRPGDTLDPDSVRPDPVSVSVSLERDTGHTHSTVSGTHSGHTRDTVEKSADSGSNTACRHCGADSTRWLADDRDTRALAAKDCHGCPVFTECAAVGEHEAFGVWAGADRTPEPRTPRRKDTAA